MRADVERALTALRCCCPRHPGGREYSLVTDFVLEHQGVTPFTMLESEVRIMLRHPIHPQGVAPMIFTGRLDDAFERTEDHILVTVWGTKDCQVAFRRNSWDIWSPPTTLTEAEH